MLRLKRASAGSGKTYQLAKTYIKLLLFQKEKEEGKKRHLRNEAALQEALRSIMAVTFTVKATAEMKERIVKNLAEIASADKCPVGEENKIPYLEEFMADFHATKDQIAFLAKEALKTLLLHYSDFKVQTIDSFFQSILHTFAYEASLDDNFNMEIDSDYTSSIGFDAALDEIVSSADKMNRRETLYWLRKMMGKSNASNQWNVFARTDGKWSLYTSLIEQAKNLEKEDFQTKRKLVEDYFDSLNRPFRDIVAEVDDANLAHWKTLHENRRLKAKEFLETIQKYHLELSDIFNRPEAPMREALEDFDEGKLDKLKVPKFPTKNGSRDILYSKTRDSFDAFLSRHEDVNESSLNDIWGAFREWYDATTEYRDAYNDPAKRMQIETWLAYRNMFAPLIVVLEIGKKKRELLEATNTLEISDTSHILARIIGEDDTPFVYERMGARLSHYLIDEFQDTSHMQWHNLKPLLVEAHSRGKENLIIGDAKQSIYRFRNADYRLITEGVPNAAEFKDDLVYYTSENRPADWSRENTNFRSEAKIVKFNNHVFKNLVSLRRHDGSDIFDDEIKVIYRDVEQFIPDKSMSKDGKKSTKERNLGFVDVKVYPPLKSDEKLSYDSVGYVSLAEPGFVELPARILELGSRGYDFREIAVLVKTHDQGQGVIKVLAAYNLQNPDNQIPVISEENLLVASALSVKIIVHALELALKGKSEELPDNPMLADPIDETKLFELLSSLQSQAIPSIVEAVTKEFIPEKRRDAEAPFIAAFQDAAIDYCASHTSDIGSFLKWWKRRAKTLSINTPENSNGVRINTIHGSKGLEYPCVIIPLANINFYPSKNMKEWKWVRPASCVLKNDLLPPYLPVETGLTLNSTAHDDVWRRFLTDVALDEINKLYVGFTRAAKELYVYCPLIADNAKGQPDPESTAGRALEAILSEGLIRYGDEEEKLEIISPAPELGEDSIEFKYGSPLTPDEIAAGRKKERKDVKDLRDYKVYTHNKFLKFQDANGLVGKKQNDDEESDPRSEGTLKHRLMQMIERPSDLQKALKVLTVEGLASPDKIREWGEELTNAIKAKESYGWFAEDVKVLNERTVIRKREKYHRPDRIVMRPDGTVEIIDYKFGSPRAEHKTQVKEYIDLITATGMFRKVSGYLWYVTSGEVEKVL